MKKWTAFFIVSLSACSTVNEKEEFVSGKGCYLLYNMKTKKIEREVGTTCRKRFVACSTFKVPLAVMAFDSGLLKDEKQVLKWDGVQRDKIADWNRDHDAESWMKYSVVWFSQRLTPRLGKDRFQRYLHDFRYGNQNLEGGLTEAWLVSPGKLEPSLRISPIEQVKFMESLWNETLPVSKRAMKLTQKITALPATPSGFSFSGKTGSNSYDKEQKIHLGWFIAHLEKGEQEYVAVVNFSDDKPFEGTPPFGGPRAREMMIEYLKSDGLW